LSDAHLLRTAKAMAYSGEYATCEQVRSSLVCLGYRRANVLLAEAFVRAEVDQICAQHTA
jgi:hypothetical protein